jgi:hypothetical protein
MNRHVLGNYGHRPGYVRTQYVLCTVPYGLLRTYPRNPGAIYDDWQRSKPHLLCAKTICWMNSHGRQSATNNEQSRSSCKAWGPLNSLREGHPCRGSQRIGELPVSGASRSQCTSPRGPWSWLTILRRSGCPAVEPQWR